MPDPLLIRHRGLFSGAGRSLDLASGLGDNAIFLAELGYDAFAVDGSTRAMTAAVHRARARGVNVYGWVADLDVYPLPPARFDLVVVFRYLNRARIERFKSALKVGGLFVYKTFNTGFLQNNPSFSKHYVLSAGELKAHFDTWECIDTNDYAANPAPQSFWIGRRR